MSTVEHDKDTENDSNSTQLTNSDPRQVINQTFDEAKNKTTKNETHRDLRHMQTITNSREQTHDAARDIIDNYIESQ